MGVIKENMKKSNFIIFTIVLVSMVIFSHCKKKTYTLDSAPSKVEGLNGSWTLYSVIQVDEISLSKEEKDISSFYIPEDGNDVTTCTFSSSDRTFTITPGSEGRNYLPSSGTWSFDDDQYPQYIYIEDENGVVSTLKLQGPTRPVDQYLKFSFQRTCIIDGVEKEYVGYRYEFNRN